MNNRSFGILALCAYLTLVGISLIFHLIVPALLLGIIAILAAVLIFIGK